MNIFTTLSPCVPTPVYDAYWKFAAERQKIFYSRLEGNSSPWTKDPILKAYKFTNAYRASDRVSQYLIKEVIYGGSAKLNEEDTIFRILLFKTFNKIETWDYLVSNLGEISYKAFKFETINDLLSQRFNQGISIYSGAYIMHSGKSAFLQKRKHSNHLLLIEMMMKSGLAKDVAKARSLSCIYDLLIEYPTIGSFLAYQYTIDINYSELSDFSENEFVVPGPGAIDGLSKVFSSKGGLSPVDLIKLMCDRQTFEFERLNLKFKNLWGRDLQLIDCQNLFCEISKYSRVSHPEIQGVAKRTRIKQRYSEKHALITPFYPPKWNINNR